VLATPPRRRLRCRRQLLRLRRDVGSPAPSLIPSRFPSIFPRNASVSIKKEKRETPRFESRDGLSAHLQTCLLARYPVPQRSETRGRSEELLGRWLRARRVPRDSVVVATKVSNDPALPFYQYFGWLYVL
jgi:hypothetical protein